jgi:hypothetical protein
MSFARMFPQMLDEDLLKMQAQHGAVQEDFLPDEELVGTHDAAQAITEARMRSIARDSDEIQAGEEESIIDSNRKPIVPADEAVRSAEQVTPKVEKEKGWSPNFLAAAAAFTQNPALMQMLKERQEGPQRELEQSYKDAEAKRKAEKHDAGEHLTEARSACAGHRRPRRRDGEAFADGGAGNCGEPETLCDARDRSRKAVRQHRATRCLAVACCGARSSVARRARRNEANARRDDR